MALDFAIPDSPEAMQDFLNDEDNRKKVFGETDPQVAKDFLAEYSKLVNKGDAISKQVSEQLAAQLTQTLKDFGVSDMPTKADIDALIPKALAQDPKLAAHYNPRAPGASVENIGFDSFGHLAQVVLRDRAQAAGEANLSESDVKAYNELKRITAAYSSNNPESAGFLIPESTRAEIMSMALETAVIRPRATTITMSTKSVDVPFVDVTSHASSLFGGMVWYWTEESGAITATEAKFGKVRLEANKLTGGARIPNELLADAPALGSFLNRAMPEGLAFFEDIAFIEGSGVGEPLGFTQSPAIVQATRAGANTTFAQADATAMYARMLPQSLGRAVWLVNQTQIDNVISVTDSIGLTGRNAADSPAMTLLGRPIIVTEKLPAKANGSGNDVMFVDLSYYLIGDRQAVSIDSSPHSRFMNDETELRVIHRVDGRPWIQSALTPYKGSTTLSPFVGVDD